MAESFYLKSSSATSSFKSSTATPYVSAVSPSTLAAANASPVEATSGWRTGGRRRMTYLWRNLHDYWRVVWGSWWAWLGLIDGHSQPVEVENLSRMMKIGSHLHEVTKCRLIYLLQENTDLFTLTATNMPSINAEVTSHHLKVYPTCRPEKQNRWCFALQCQEAVMG